MSTSTCKGVVACFQPCNFLLGIYDKIDKSHQKRTRGNSLTENCPVKAKRVRLESTKSSKDVATPKEVLEVEAEEKVMLEHDNSEDPGWDKDFNPWGTGTLTPKGELYENFIRKRELVKYQSQCENIKVML